VCAISSLKSLRSLSHLLMSSCVELQSTSILKVKVTVKVGEDEGYFDAIRCVIKSSERFRM